MLVNINNPMIVLSANYNVLVRYIECGQSYPGCNQFFTGYSKFKIEQMLEKNLILYGNVVKQKLHEN